MSIKDIDSKKIKEELTSKVASGFYQIFAKNLRRTLNPKEMEAMTKSLKDVVNEIFKAVELKAIELSVRLAESTDEGFEKVGKKIDAADAQIRDIRQDTTVISKLQDEVEELKDKIESLEKKLKKKNDDIIGNIYS